MKFSYILEALVTGEVIEGRSLEQYRNNKIKAFSILKEAAELAELTDLILQNKQIEQTIEQDYGLLPGSAEGLLTIMSTEAILREMLDDAPEFIDVINDPTSNVKLFISFDTRFNFCVVCRPGKNGCVVRYASQPQTLRGCKG